MATSKSGVGVNSMTGFARVATNLPTAYIELEMRSVNNRFLEINCRGPRGVQPLERDIKALIQRNHRRGRIDLSVFYRARPSEEHDAGTGWEKIDAAMAAYGAACKRYGIRGEGAAQFLGSLVSRENSVGGDGSVFSDEETRAIMELVSQVSDELLEARKIEGGALIVDIGGRVSEVERIRGEIFARMTGAPNRLRERLRERLAALAPDIVVDPERLATEIAILADKVDVSEEIARLEIHIEQFGKTLEGHPDGVGRKLDFLTQEISRELNTIGSKAQDATVQGLVVDAKAEVERIREQIQNLE